MSVFCREQSAQIRFSWLRNQFEEKWRKRTAYSCVLRTTTTGLLIDLVSLSVASSGINNPESFYRKFHSNNVRWSQNISRVYFHSSTATKAEEIKNNHCHNFERIQQHRVARTGFSAMDLTAQVTAVVGTSALLYYITAPKKSCQDGLALPPWEVQSTLARDRLVRSKFKKRGGGNTTTKMMEYDGSFRRRQERFSSLSSTMSDASVNTTASSPPYSDSGSVNSYRSAGPALWTKLWMNQVARWTCVASFDDNSPPSQLQLR
jgi:hypothetical protein